MGEGRGSEAITKLESLLGDPEMDLAIMAAIVHAHKSAKGVVDVESVESYEGRLIEEQESASASALVECALFYHLSNGPDSGKAKETAMKALDTDSNDSRAKTLLGWIELTGRGEAVERDERTDDANESASADVVTLRRASRKRAAKALGVFDAVLSSQDRGGEAEIDAIVGKAQALTALSRYDGVVDCMNELAARHPGFAPAASEKAKARLAASDFDGASENCTLGLASDSDDCECHRIQVFLTLTRTGDYTQARAQMGLLEEALHRREPRNYLLHLDVAKQIARVAGGDVGVLTTCGRLLDKALQLDPENVSLLLERAHQLRFLNKYVDALDLYASVTSANEATKQKKQKKQIANSVLFGTAMCLLLRGKFTEASGLIEQFAETSVASMDTGAAGLPLSFLSALSQHLDEGNASAKFVEETINNLENSMTSFLQNLNKHPHAIDTFVAMDPDVMIKSALIFTEHDFAQSSQGFGERDASTSSASNINQANVVDVAGNDATPRSLRILEALCMRAPGLVVAQEHLMRARFAAGCLEASARTASALLRLRDQHAEAHVMLARIHLAHSDHVSARQALDAATANDFSVRGTTEYAVVSARCAAAEGDTRKALGEIEAAMKLPGVRVVMKSSTGNSTTIKSVPMSTADRASLFVAYADALSLANRGDEAEKVLDEAAKVFTGTSSEIFVMIARCDIAVVRGDDSKALRALSRVTPDSPHYAAATVALANVHLKIRKDVSAFIKCHRELVEHNPDDSNSWLLLAEAYGTVGGVNEQVNALQRANTIAPEDASIARKLASALVATHDYKNAVRHYEAAVRRIDESVSIQSGSRSQSGNLSQSGNRNTSSHETDEHMTMRMELARLYKRLRRWSDAERTILRIVRDEGEIHERSEVNNTTNVSPQLLRVNIEAFKLLCSVKSNAGDQAGYLDSLLNVKRTQDLLLQKAQRGGDLDGESIATLKRSITKTCAECASLYASFHDVETSIKLLTEALKYDPSDVNVMAQMANTKLNVGDTMGAEVVLHKIVKLDAENEDANLMLAEFMFLREDVDGAVFHFRDVLAKNPGQFEALSQLVKLLHRAGRLIEIDVFFENAERSLGMNVARSSSGFWFAKGMAAKLSSDFDKALEHFNRCRQDSHHGINSSYEMAEIYLSPYTCMTKKGSAVDGNTKKERSSAAERILQEINQRIEPKHTILSAYCLMSRGDAKVYDQAFDMCSSVLTHDNNNAPALLATANCFELQKLPAKAKGLLKQISKLNRRSDEADAFEAAWLVSAEQAFNAGKLDQAQDFCQKCLQYNKSCVGAWEILGMVCERETGVIDAGECYEHAWRHCSESDPGIGFKLAFVLFKAKAMVQCVDVCRAVLSKFPTYPKIKKDIMKKAQLAIRP